MVSCIMGTVGDHDDDDDDDDGRSADLGLWGRGVGARFAVLHDLINWAELAPRRMRSGCDADIGSS